MMKPISLQMYPDYEKILSDLGTIMERYNSDGRVISRTHLLRFALRVASGEPANEITVRKVLVDEEARGKKPGSAGAKGRPRGKA